MNIFYYISKTFCKSSDEFIDYIKEYFTQKVKDIDIVFDCVGGKTGADSIKVVKRGGTMISISGGISQENKTLDQILRCLVF